MGRESLRNSTLYYSVAVVLFAVGSVVDNLITYYLVVVAGVARELNPLARSFIFTHPLWMWFLRDFIGFAIATIVGLAYWYLIDSSTRRFWWVIPLVVGVCRLLPAIHNVLAIIGYETPLYRLVSPIYYVLKMK